MFFVSCIYVYWFWNLIYLICDPWEWLIGNFQYYDRLWTTVKKKECKDIWFSNIDWNGLKANHLWQLLRYITTNLNFSPWFLVALTFVSALQCRLYWLELGWRSGCNHLVNRELLYPPFQNVGCLNFVLSQTSLILAKLIEKYVKHLKYQINALSSYFMVEWN